MNLTRTGTPPVQRPALAALVFSPLVILAAALGGWPALILAAMFTALIWAAWTDDNRND